MHAWLVSYLALPMLIFHNAWIVSQHAVPWNANRLDIPYVNLVYPINKY